MVLPGARCCVVAWSTHSNKYPECMKELTQLCEPLVSTKPPDCPWQKIETDLFVLKGENSLLAVDYFSRYPEVIKLKTTLSSGIIDAFKSLFSHHGIPETLISDSGPRTPKQSSLKSRETMTSATSPAVHTIQKVMDMLKEVSRQ